MEDCTEKVGTCGNENERGSFPATLLNMRVKQESKACKIKMYPSVFCGSVALTVRFHMFESWSDENQMHNLTAGALHQDPFPTFRPGPIQSVICF